MTVFRPRTRLLTVRLSEEEYEELRRICAEEGARSLSDFARESILQRAQTSGFSKGSLAGDLTVLGDQLENVDEAIKALSKRIERVLGKPVE